MSRVLEMIISWMNVVTRKNRIRNKYITSIVNQIREKAKMIWTRHTDKIIECSNNDNENKQKKKEGRRNTEKKVVE